MCWCCRLLIAAAFVLGIVLIWTCGIPLVEIGCMLYPSGI